MTTAAATPRADCELPPLSPMAMRIITQSQDPDASANDLARLIELDAAVTVALLRLVNSPFYGMPRNVGTVTDAILVLGLATVRRVVMAITLRQPLSAARLDPNFVREIWRNIVRLSGRAGRSAAGWRCVRRLRIHGRRAARPRSPRAATRRPAGVPAVDDPGQVRAAAARARHLVLRPRAARRRAGFALALQAFTRGDPLPWADAVVRRYEALRQAQG